MDEQAVILFKMEATNREMIALSKKPVDSKENLVKKKNESEETIKELEKDLAKATATRDALTEKLKALKEKGK